jgi:hypothetical protein
MTVDGNYPFDPPKRPIYRTARGAFRSETEDELRERVGPMHYRQIMLHRRLLSEIANSNPFLDLVKSA